MNNTPKVDLIQIARQAMQDRGFKTDFPQSVIKQAETSYEPDFNNLKLRDLSDLLWSSIDNDDSKDLDQIEYSEEIPSGIRVYVGIADVNSLVYKGSPTDNYAMHNTTSVYTGVEVFPMLPVKFSTDLTSLNENQKRLAVVAEMEISKEGVVTKSTIYSAIVRNKAQLTYDAVHSWLEKNSVHDSDFTKQIIAKIDGSPDLQKQITTQDKAAQSLRKKRFKDGALDFHTVELRSTFSSTGNISLSTKESNRASQIIEEFMIASNESVDLFLQTKNYPCLQRVVRTPKNWLRMVDLAKQHGGNLPQEPDGIALQKFLATQQISDPDNFPNISLAMIKLLGRGEYVVKASNQEGLGHFGLAAANYSHTTAPNRRYPDLLTQRLLKSAFNNSPLPYSISELEELAAHCTEKEDDANRVERQVHKCIAAVALSGRIGEVFSGIITGSSDKGVFVRISDPLIEGKIENRLIDLKVGEPVKVKLVHTDPYRGFIDFQVLNN